MLHGDGHELGSGLLPLPIIEPQRSLEIDFKSGPWYSVWSSSDAVEFYLTVTSKHVCPTRWAEPGHVISSTQVQLPAREETVPRVSGPPDICDFI